MWASNKLQPDGVWPAPSVPIRKTPMNNDSLSALHFRVATADDRPRLIAIINVAFAIETFLEDTRTDEERLAAICKKEKSSLPKIAKEISSLRSTPSSAENADI